MANIDKFIPKDVWIQLERATETVLSVIPSLRNEQLISDLSANVLMTDDPDEKETLLEAVNETIARFAEEVQAIAAERCKQKNTKHRLEGLVNHTLNNSLSIAKEKLGLAQDLHNEHKLRGEKKRTSLEEAVSTIRAACSSILAHEFLVMEDPAKKEFYQPEIENISISHFFSEIEWTLDYRFHKSTSINNPITIEIPEEIRDLQVRVHCWTLFHLTTNICANASSHGEATNLEIRLTKENDFLVITISDNGSGIESDVETTMYDYLVSRGKEVVGQTTRIMHSGIGIAHAPERLEAFGATIECQGHGGLEGAENKKGAKYIIKVPLADVPSNALNSDIVPKPSAQLIVPVVS